MPSSAELVNTTGSSAVPSVYELRAARDDQRGLESP